MKKITYIHIVDSRMKPMSRLHAKCMQSLRDNVGDNEYRQIQAKYSEDKFEMLANVDRIKYEVGAQMPEACVVDTDCFISKPIHELPINDCTPYLARYSYDGNIVGPDICYFYVNGCTDWFKSNLPPSLVNPKQYGPNPEVFKNLSGFEYIPDMTYCHFYGSMRRVGDMVALDRAVKKLNQLTTGISHLNTLISGTE